MIPPKTDPRWRRLVSDPERYSFKLLAARILMQRVALRSKRAAGDPSVIAALIDDVHGFFTKNARIAADDLKAIFG